MSEPPLLGFQQPVDFSYQGHQLVGVLFRCRLLTELHPWLSLFLHSLSPVGMDITPDEIYSVRCRTIDILLGRAVRFG